MPQLHPALQFKHILKCFAELEQAFSARNGGDALTSPQLFGVSPGWPSPVSESDLTHPEPGI